MTESNHISSPWRAAFEAEDIVDGVPIRADERDGGWVVVAHVPMDIGRRADREAIARAIAAIPDMLEALDAAEDIAESMIALSEGRDDGWVRAGLDKIKAARAKAGC